ncbi:MAG TPA: glycosyltransferase family 4 protein [Kiritimatiellia bacterium]|nr:glycosyltransferase family 4 protein [Kiritimatiellia bacterium]
MAKMKVSFLLQDTRTLYGAEQATLQLLAGLAAAGVSISVLLLQETRLGPGISPLAEALGRRHPVTDIPVAGRFSRSAVRQIRDHMERDQTDVLHSTGYKADWHAALAAQGGARFPIVSTVHGWLFRWNLKERFFQTLNLRALKSFNRVIVLSEFYERYLRRHGLTPLQIARIRPGVRANEIVSREDAGRLWARPSAVFTFGMLGRLSEEKNHDLLLRAVARMENRLQASPRSWRILIAGDGPQRARLQAQIRRRGLGTRVWLAGRMEPDDFFSQVHVLVQCSRVENQPRSVLEAMAWTRPAIVTRAGGMPEQVCDGQTGLLVPNGNARVLAAAMQHYLVAPEQAARAGARARERLEASYGYPEMIARHLGVYETAARH